MTKIVEAIEINCAVETVFATLTDGQNIVNFSQDVSAVTPDDLGALVLGTTYRQIRTIHDRKNLQSVTVTNFAPPHLFELRTQLFKIDVTHAYKLSKTAQNTTLLTLTKSAQVKGWTKIFSPLLKHLFTRPEHDGPHLTMIKKFVEAKAAPEMES